MEKKKERILMQSLRRQQQVEDSRRVKEMETLRRKEEEARKQEEKLRKREEEKARRQAILESYRLKKQEEMEKDVRFRLIFFNFYFCENLTLFVLFVTALCMFALRISK